MTDSVNSLSKYSNTFQAVINGRNSAWFQLEEAGIEIVSASSEDPSTKEQEAINERNSAWFQLEEAGIDIF